MPDFTQLLKDAAGTPATPLNMQAVRRRAARLGLGRWRLWLAGLVALVGVGVPTGSALLPASDRPTRVETERDQRQAGDDDTPSSGEGARAQLRTGSSARAGATSDGSGPPGGTPVAATNQRIAYTVGSDLYVADLDGTKARYLVGNALSVPSWAPDGNRIAYVAEIPAGDGDAVYCDYDGPPFGNQCPPGRGVTVVNVDGSGKRLVTEGDHPTWSPDGNWIAFVGDGISVIRPDGTEYDASSPPRESPHTWTGHPTGPASPSPCA